MLLPTLRSLWDLETQGPQPATKVSRCQPLGGIGFCPSMYLLVAETLLPSATDKMCLRFMLEAHT